MRRTGVVLMLLLLLASVAAPALARAESGPPAIPAKAYLLMDGATGDVLLEYEGRTELPIASTTKIMTALLALEHGNLADVVTVGQKPYETGGSTIWLELGEQITLENLLYALMLDSANDAAVALAEHLAGTEDAFVGWMNERAAAVGATHTHFANSHGLHEPDHYSTAYDLALIARHAMQNQAFRELVAVVEKEIPGAKENPPRQLYNRNRLLGYYEGITGVKNGFTEEAGLTLVASARRGETELIAVVLGAESRIWTSSMALLEYGFNHLVPARVAMPPDPAVLAVPAAPVVEPGPEAPPAPSPEPTPAETAVPLEPWLLAIGLAAAVGLLTRPRRRTR